MSEFLAILNAIAATTVIAGAFGSVFFYLSRQVSRITQQSQDIAVLQTQLEAEQQRHDKTIKQLDHLIDWVNLLKDKEEIAPSVKIPHVDDSN
jgi:uncharacterized coiled-coil protein SlyX